MHNDQVPRIVIVDDDPADAYVLKRAISNSSIVLDVKTLVDGAAFVDFYSSEESNSATNRRQLFLLDINMPMLNGFEALAALNELKMPRHSPIIMFSTSSVHSDVARAYELGVNGYVKKPSAIEEAENTMVALNLFWLKTNIAAGFRYIPEQSGF